GGAVARPHARGGRPDGGERPGCRAYARRRVRRERPGGAGTQAHRDLHPAHHRGPAPTRPAPHVHPAHEHRVLAGPAVTPESGSGGRMHVSIVLPCYNEEDHVRREIERICAAMDATGYEYELIAVDDASTDSTLDVLLKAEVDFPNVRAVAFRRNGGAGTVRRIGSQQARGDIVVWTDA